MCTSILHLGLLVLGPALPGDVSLFRGSPGGAGDVVSTDESGLGPVVQAAALQGVTLLPVDFAGRVALQQLDPARPRLREDVPGAARVQLPNGAGSLYRYRRDLTGGGAQYGFFVVPASGAALPIWERAGTGPAADVDPFLPRVAIAPAGDAILVATTVAAGGDLWEVDLATATAQDRTSADAPLAFVDGGIALLDDWGLATASDRLLRFDRTPGAVAAELALSTPEGPPVHFGGAIATCDDGSRAMTAAGSGPQAQHVFVFGSSGAAQRVSDAPRLVSNAGYLPEEDHGPYMALSADGSLCAWRTTEFNPIEMKESREAWLARVELVPDTPVQLTADGNFTDTLDEIGLFGFVQVDRLLLGVGELADPLLGGIDSTDVHRVALDPATGLASFTNTTLSSGDTAVPFLSKPTIDPSAFARLPGTDAFLLHDDKGEELKLVDAAAGSTALLLSQVKSVDVLENAGGGLLLSLRRSDPLNRRELWRMPSQPGAAPVLVASLPLVVNVDRSVPAPDGGVGAVIEYFGFEWTVRVDALTGLATTPFLMPITFGPSLAWTPNGALAMSSGPAGAAAVHAVWTPGAGLVVLPLPPAPAFLLPGS